MSRKKHKRPADAVPDEILAEGSGPATASSGDAGGEVVVRADADPDAEAGRDPDADSEAIEATADALAEAARDIEARMAEEGEQPDDGGDETAALDEREAVEVEAAGEAAAPEGEALGDEVGAVLPASASEIDDVTLVRLVEALIFASDKPLTVQRLRQLSRIADVRRIEHALEQIAADHADRGIALQHVSGGYQFRTNTAYSAWVQQLVAGRPVRLSRAQLETLAIVAYRQPITRPEIDEIRGVDSSATLRLLLDRSLVRVLGKREEVGRPMLYGTTGEFLDFFSLQDLRELPTLREYSELTAESRQVMSDRLGVGLEPEAAEPNETSDVEPTVASDVEPEHMTTAPDDAVAEPTREPE